MKILNKILFLILFLAGAYYINYIETEKYASSSVIKIKDLSTKQSISSISSMILGEQDIKAKADSELVSIYIKSQDMFDKLNKDFNLTNYYSSKDIDKFHRLDKNTKIYFLKLNRENLLKSYRNDLNIVYDDISSTLEVTFYHHDPKKAREILKKIIEYSGEALNRLDKKNASTLVDFLKKQEKYYRKKYINSIAKIIAFQNKAGLVDPTINIKSISELLSTLEAELIKKEVEYQAMGTKVSANTNNMRSLKTQIYTLRTKIKKLKEQLSGNRGKKLNRDQFEFQKLSSEVEFTKELYRQTLLKLEDAKISSTQNAKNTLIVVKPTLAEQYSRPNKIKNTFTLFMVLLFLYSIINIFITILNEHKD